MQRVKLGDIAAIDISGVDKKTKAHESSVRLCNFTDVYYNWAITKELSSSFMTATANENQISKFLLKKGQVAITKDSETRDDIGVAAYIADDFDDVLLGYHCALITPDQSKLDGRYLNAFLHSPFMQQFFSANASGSGQRYTLSADILNSIPVLLPSSKEQQLIGEYFSSVDRKISNNQQIKASLESLARTIYEHWFLQYDYPSDNGKPYKSSGGKMVWNSALKKNIPHGWEVRSLSSLCVTELGGTPDTGNQSYWDGTFKWLNSGEVAAFPILDSEKTITQAGIDNSATVLIPQGSVTLSITRHLRPSILAIDACINQSVVAILESEDMRKEFLYPMIVYEIPRLMALRTGAQQPHINKEIVDNICVVVPPNDILKRYYNTVSGMYDEIINAAKESKVLSQQRDYLLPLLISGQVSIN